MNRQIFSKFASPARFFKVWPAISGAAKVDYGQILPGPSTISILLFLSSRVQQNFFKPINLSVCNEIFFKLVRAFQVQLSLFLSPTRFLRARPDFSVTGQGFQYFFTFSKVIIESRNCLRSGRIFLGFLSVVCFYVVCQLYQSFVSIRVICFSC